MTDQTEMRGLIERLEKLSHEYRPAMTGREAKRALDAHIVPIREVISLLRKPQTVGPDLAAENARLVMENAHLRVVAAKAGCPYGHNAKGAGCELGYPGCVCMDDLLALQTWSPEDEAKAAVRLGSRLAAANAENVRLREEVFAMTTERTSEDLFGDGYAMAQERLRAILALISPAPNSESADRWRPEVRAVADLMEAKLRENDHKPGGKNDNDIADVCDALPLPPAQEPQDVG